MNETFDRLASAQAQPSCTDTSSNIRSAIGLVIAGGVSLGMWVALAQAIRWAANTVF